MASSVGAIRAWWREVHPPPTLTKRLEPVYYVLITLGIGGPFAYGTASNALAAVATPRALAAWGPAAGLLAVWAGARWGAVQGPVVFSLADVAQLLGSPLRRGDLALGRLLRGLLAATGGAAVIGGLVLVGLAGHGRGVAPARAAGLVVGVALLGLLAMAGASLVEGSARWDRVTRRAGWPLLAVAVGLVVLGTSGAAGRRIAGWCGPGGWAVQPAGGARAWPVALALLLVASAGAAVLAVARRGECATERYLVRAEARGGAVAALYAMNARYVRRSLGKVSAGPVAARRRGPRPPRAPALTIPWRDLVAAVAVPQRLAEALVLAAGGMLLVLLDARRPVAVGMGALAVFAAASRLLEPLRAETDNPARTRVLLPRPMGRVLVEHALVPTLVVVAAALVAVAGVSVAGALPRHGGAAALLAVAAVPSIALCAALNSRRGGRLPASVMAAAYTDASGMASGIVVGWIVLWPVLAAVLGALPVSLVVHSGTAGLTQLVILLAVAPAVLAAGLSWRRFEP